MTKRIAVIDDRVLMSSFKLTRPEKVLLWLAISEIRHKEKVLAETWYEVDINDYATLEGLLDKSAYDMAKEVSESLPKKVFIVTKDKLTTTCQWVSKVQFDKEARSLKVKFSSTFIPYISELSKRFNSLPLLESFSISSLYTWRLYDVFRTSDKQKKFKKVPRLALDLEELYWILKVPKSYRVYKEFNRRVITPMIEELEKLEIAKVEINVNKRKGRKVVGLTFHITWWPVVEELKGDDDINKLLKEHGIEDCKLGSWVEWNEVA